MRRIIVTGLALFALSACERQSAESAKVGTPPPATAALRYAATGDLSGYYLPAGTIEVNNHRLHHLFIGQAREFEAWEKGERTATFAPVMLQFDDLSSPTGTNELGQTYHERTVRVLPTSYEVTDEAVRFEGDSSLGRVSFQGRLDRGALATARRNLGGGEAPVLTGTLRIGASTFSNVKFTWFGGD